MVSCIDGTHRAGLSVCLSACLSVCLSGWLSICLSVCLSGRLSIRLADWLFVYLPGCLAGWLAGWLAVLSVREALYYLDSVRRSARGLAFMCLVLPWFVICFWAAWCEEDNDCRSSGPYKTVGGCEQEP
jgi:hypothetical protein